MFINLIRNSLKNQPETSEKVVSVFRAFTLPLILTKAFEGTTFRRVIGLLPCLGWH